MKINECYNGEYFWLQVTKNDTLPSIMQQYSVGLNSIVRNNPQIDLYEGEIIKVVKNTRTIHIVKPMETLDTIAQKYDIKVANLIENNNLTSKRLFVGQTLIIKTN